MFQHRKLSKSVQTPHVMWSHVDFESLLITTAPGSPSFPSPTSPLPLLFLIPAVVSTYVLSSHITHFIRNIHHMVRLCSVSSTWAACSLSSLFLLDPCLTTSGPMPSWTRWALCTTHLALSHFTHLVAPCHTTQERRHADEDTSIPVASTPLIPRPAPWYLRSDVLDSCI